MLLQAGPVQALYDRGFLRYIQTADQEMVRMIYFAIRDQDWQTMLGSISDEHIQTTPDTFSISYINHVNQDKIQMEWQVRITGEANGTITFSLHGTAQSNFLKNRAGFCVLHPITGIIGQPCCLEHPDGSTSNGTFPTFISPHQPFLNVSAMEWPVAEQGLARLEFSGDIFETEDQRNWSDASFKTYCTPQTMPIPAQINIGDEINQQVIFRLPKQLPVSSNQIKPAPHLIIQNQPVPFPKIGLGTNVTSSDLHPEEITFLRSIGIKHLRTEIFLNVNSWQVQLEQAVYQSSKLHLPLELALYFSDEASEEVRQFISYLQPQNVQLSRFLIFDVEKRYTSESLLLTVVPVLRTAFPGVSLGGGSDANFTEFNRHPFTFSLIDFVAYAINPQVHAIDDLTIIENAAAQADTVQSARHLVGNLPVHVSPVTLKPRGINIATPGHAQNFTPADPRQYTDFVAGWTFASIKYLAEAGVSSITYYETTGPNGIIQDGKPFPVGNLLKYILQYNPEQILPTTYSEPLKVTPILFLKGTGSCLILANHTAESQSFFLPENFTVHTHTLIGSTTSQESYANFVPGKQITLTPYQTIALEEILGGEFRKDL